MSKNMQLYEYEEDNWNCPVCGTEMEKLFHDSAKCVKCNLIWKIMWVPHSLAEPE